MKRIALLLAVVGALLSCSRQEPKDEVSVQLYSLYTLIGSPDLYAVNSAEVFQTLAELGYTSVEAAYFYDGEFYGVSPEQFRADVEAAGLKALSSHTARPLSDEELAKGELTDALEWWDFCIEAHKAAGMEYIVTPHLVLPPTLAELKTICDYFNAIGKKCAEQGMKFGYHTQSYDFYKVEDQIAMDFMLQNTDPQCVFFQMDVQLATLANASPVEYFKKYPGRFEMLHIKDVNELGQSGTVGFDAIFRNLSVAGTKQLVVEEEEFSSDDWKACMKANIDYIHWLKSVIK